MIEITLQGNDLTKFKFRWMFLANIASKILNHYWVGHTVSKNGEVLRSFTVSRVLDLTY